MAINDANNSLNYDSMNQLCGSPLERLLADYLYEFADLRKFDIQLQKRFGKYRVDFYLESKIKDLKIILEVDGAEYHNYDEDLMRDNNLIKYVDYLVRFEAKMVYLNPLLCLEELDMLFGIILDGKREVFTIKKKAFFYSEYATIIGRYKAKASDYCFIKYQIKHGKINKLAEIRDIISEYNSDERYEPIKLPEEYFITKEYLIKIKN